MACDYCKPSRLSISNSDFWINRASFSFHSEIPTDACWSPDGSLLALSLNRQIALYDPTSNRQIESLAIPEIRKIHGVSFVGSTGRYLAIRARRVVVIWDLVSQQGK